MKSDLATSIGVAIIGVVAAYFVCNIFIGDIEPVKVKTVDASVSATLANPDPEVFNYRALNPTVEVYVGECTEYNESGECLDGTIIENNYDEQDFNTPDGATDDTPENSTTEESTINNNTTLEQSQSLLNNPETP